MLSSPGFGSAWNHLNHTMFLYVLLACVSWVLESHSAPMKIISGSTQDNHTAVCAEIEKELMADNVTYKGSFERPQNTSEELCYGKFIEGFISTLNNISTKHKNDCHIEKVCKNMRQLTEICPKLKLTGHNCITEKSNFSKFKEALKSVVISIEGWKSCKRIKGIL
ncbi:PREDICTED: uncharacterized protein LOC105005555 [Bison bison bison]|nr:PREDICTED: uncharacterized protein LOC105005555 [Bison bison bison]XP_014336474.1 PREDICTED: uncharacterized protein LOC106701259 [Bos mutus]